MLWVFMDVYIPLKLMLFCWSTICSFAPKIRGSFAEDLNLVLIKPPNFYPSNFWVTSRANRPASCIKWGSRGAFFSLGISSVLQGLQHWRFLSALWSSCIKSNYRHSFFSSLLFRWWPALPSSSDLSSGLPQLLFSQVCWAAVQSPREQTRREQTLPGKEQR